MAKCEPTPMMDEILVGFNANPVNIPLELLEINRYIEHMNQLTPRPVLEDVT
jgi:hypothetical protein